MKWTRPLLPPLRPISTLAAHETFLDIAGEIEDEEAQIQQMLDLADNLPLAVNILASLVSVEGCSTIINRWSTEKTSLLSDGVDRRSNLHLSISLSLSSPRLLSSPAARDLLSLLSLLPDGLSEVDLASLSPAIPDIPKSKTTLLRTSLAYTDHDGRLKALSPIREYIQQAHPAPAALIRPLSKHFLDLVKLWKSFRTLPPGDLIPRITANLGNIHNIILSSLTEHGPHLKDVVESILFLHQFTQITSRGPTDLIGYVPDLIERLGDDDADEMNGFYILSIFIAQNSNVPEAEALAAKGIQHYQKAKDFPGEGAYVPFRS